MPTRKPVNISAQVRFFSPNTRISTMAIFCAAPLLATSLPNMAPMQTMPSNPASRLPMPLSSTPGTLSMGNPSRMAATEEETRKARKGWIFPQLISSTSSTIDANTYQISISEPGAGDVQPDARQHVVRSHVQRLAVVAELAVGRGLAVPDAAQAFAILGQHDHAARPGGEQRAVRGHREAVGKSGRRVAHESRKVVELRLAGDIAAGVERVRHEDGLGGLGLRDVEHALVR